jgi:dienelactone hydrolase
VVARFPPLALALWLFGCGSSDEPAQSPAPERTGCESNVALLDSSADAAAPGPWPVGARVVNVQGLVAEVWYPATPGSEQGATPKRYDVRDWLPEDQRDEIPDADAPFQDGGAYPDLPLDDAHGPYPAVVFVHGTAGWRTQSLALVEHWASRGFVVIAADHPGLYLGDMLALNLARDLGGDIEKLRSTLVTPSGDLAFLSNRIDATRIGMAGHSAGGNAIANQGESPGVRVLIALAAGGTTAGSALESSLVMGGKADAVVPYAEQVGGYEASPRKKRLVGVEGAGHLFPTDLCHLENAAGEDLVEIAQKHQIQNAQFASVLFDCPTTEPPREQNRQIVSFATAAVLEETLLCDERASFDGFAARFPEVTELREEL